MRCRPPAQIQPAADTYHKMEKIDAFGASIAATGLADISLYQGTTTDAIPLLEKGVAADISNKDHVSAANKLTALAAAYLLAGNKAQAVSAADRAVARAQSEDSEAPLPADPRRRSCGPAPSPSSSDSRQARSRGGAATFPAGACAGSGLRGRCPP